MGEQVYFKDKKSGYTYKLSSLDFEKEFDQTAERIKLKNQDIPKAKPEKKQHKENNSKLEQGIKEVLLGDFSEREQQAKKAT